MKIFYVLRLELTIEKTGDSEANECEIRLRYRIGSEPMYAMDEIKHGTFVKTLKNFRPGNYSSTFKVTFYLSPNLPSHIKTLRASGEQPRVSVSCSESSVSDWVPVSISVSSNE